jgi:hypothetical protein
MREANPRISCILQLTVAKDFAPNRQLAGSNTRPSARRSSRTRSEGDAGPSLGNSRQVLDLRKVVWQIRPHREGNAEVVVVDAGHAAALRRRVPGGKVQAAPRHELWDIEHLSTISYLAAHIVNELGAQRIHHAWPELGNCRRSWRGRTTKGRKIKGKRISRPLLASESPSSSRTLPVSWRRQARAGRPASSRSSAAAHRGRRKGPRPRRRDARRRPRRRRDARHGPRSTATTRTSESWAGLRACGPACAR